MEARSGVIAVVAHANGIEFHHGVQLRQLILGNCLQFAHDGHQAASDPFNLGLPLRPDPLHRALLCVQICSHCDKSFEHGAYPLGELGAGEVVVQLLHLFIASSIHQLQALCLQQDYAQGCRLESTRIRVRGLSEFLYLL